MKKILLAFFVVAISFAHEKPKTPASFQVKPFAESSYYIGKNLNGTEIKDSDYFAMFLLENAHVGCVGGVSFGSPECIRFSYAASEAELREAMRRIKDCLDQF